MNKKTKVYGIACAGVLAVGLGVVALHAVDGNNISQSESEAIEGALAEVQGMLEAAVQNKKAEVCSVQLQAVEKLAESNVSIAQSLEMCRGNESACKKTMTAELWALFVGGFCRTLEPKIAKSLASMESGCAGEILVEARTRQETMLSELGFLAERRIEEVCPLYANR